MKRYQLVLLTCLVAAVCFAQKDSVENRQPIYVAPSVYVENNIVLPTESKRFEPTRKTLKNRINSNPKTVAVDDSLKSDFVITLYLTNMRQKMQTIDGATNGPSFNVSCSYWIELRNRVKNIILERTYWQEGTGFSIENFDKSLQRLCLEVPDKKFIDKIIEKSFPKYGKVTQVDADEKAGSKAKIVYIDLGFKDGIKTNQWFDVYKANEKGELESSRLATLKAEKVENDQTQCLAKDGKEVLLIEFGKGTQLVVKSREVNTLSKDLNKVIEKQKDERLRKEKETPGSLEPRSYHSPRYQRPPDYQQRRPIRRFGR